ncbi:hypothetical protein E2I00_014574 [Balaenoptera physalus]|uniref:Syndecan n=1 Tax=Balaenoptera physalus TaxID=9770 RepID=A0A643CBE8_BALPH|nr:hypothetical protein E2I00_014574 [Balaenoptera physalus]
MRRAWILVTLGLVACVSAESDFLEQENICQVINASLTVKDSPLLKPEDKQGLKLLPVVPKNLQSDLFFSSSFLVLEQDQPVFTLGGQGMCPMSQGLDWQCEGPVLAASLEGLMCPDLGKVTNFNILQQKLRHIGYCLQTMRATCTSTYLCLIVYRNSSLDVIRSNFIHVRAELTSDKDMYLDNSSIEEASGVYPIDDDDYASASGSGADEDGESPELTTSRPLPKLPFTSAAPRVETTTLNKIQNKIPAQTKSPEEIDKEKVHLSDSERKMDPAEEATNVYTEKHSDNLFKRTEVLAAVIAGGVIGFLFAIFLILLLVYRMRKKDEGSYDLGERKPSSTAYQKAPTKEFYA